MTDEQRQHLEELRTKASNINADLDRHPHTDPAMQNLRARAESAEAEIEKLLGALSRSAAEIARLRIDNKRANDEIEKMRNQNAIDAESITEES